jgi:hypothetical protein
MNEHAEKSSPGVMPREGGGGAWHIQSRFGSVARQTEQRAGASIS